MTKIPSTDNSPSGSVTISHENGIARVTFAHPQSNSLPGALLRELAQKITDAGTAPGTKVILLQSGGEGAFCAGASFDELLSISTQSAAEHFFQGFALVIQAIRKAPCFVVARVHGKAAGGGVGVAAAADYALATEGASVRLSELAVGIGPFTIGPAVLRKVGTAAFSEMAVSAEWRDARWALNKGLYAELYPTTTELDAAVEKLLKKLSGYSLQAMRELKRVLWEGTENWDAVFAERVRTVASLVLTAEAQSAIKAAKGR